MPASDLEGLLSRALAPVDPPEGLEFRVERTLGSLVDLAADELEAWELSAMRDPRNWPRQAIGPAAAIVVGSAAAAGLVALRTQRKRHGRRASSSGAIELVGRTVRDAAHEARRLVEEATHRN